MGAEDKSNHLTADSFRSVPQDNWSLTASSGKANDDDFRPLPLPPCVDSTRAHVYIQNVPVYAGNTRTQSRSHADQELTVLARSIESDVFVRLFACHWPSCAGRNKRSTEHFLDSWGLTQKGLGRNSRAPCVITGVAKPGRPNVPQYVQHVVVFSVLVGLGELTRSFCAHRFCHCRCSSLLVLPPVLFGPSPFFSVRYSCSFALRHPPSHGTLETDIGKRRRSRSDWGYNADALTRMDPIGRAHVQFRENDSRYENTVTFILGMSGNLTLAALRERMADRFLKYERLRSRLVKEGGKYFFAECTNIDITRMARVV